MTIFYRNVPWMLLEKVVNVVLNTLFYILVARYYTVESFGEFNYVIATSGIFVVFFSINLDTLVQKKIADSTLAYSITVIRDYFSFKIIGGLAGLIALTCYLVLAQGSGLAILLLIVYSRIFFLTLASYDCYFISTGRALITARVRLLVAIAFFLVRSILIFAGFDLVYLYLTIPLEFLMVGMLYAKITRHYFKQFLFPAKITSIDLKFVKKGIPLMISGGLMILYLKIDQVMLFHLVGNVELAIYSAAVRISEGWYFIIFVVANAFFPQLASACAINDLCSFCKNLRLLLTMLICISGIIGLFLWFVSEILVAFLFGNEYTSSAEILSIHLLCGLFVAVGAVFGKWLILKSLGTYSIFHAISALFLNVSFNFLLIPKFGGYGAAMATLISQAWASLIVYTVFSETRIIFRHLFQFNKTFVS